MGRIIVVMDDGSTHEYERGLVFGYLHEELKPTSGPQECEIDFVRMDVTPIELVETDKLFDEIVKRDLKRRIKEMTQDSYFPSFFEFMLKEALSGERNGK